MQLISAKPGRPAFPTRQESEGLCASRICRGPIHEGFDRELFGHLLAGPA